jgi:hypothetical protein
MILVSTLTAEGPVLLGYGAVILLIAAVALLTSGDAATRRRRNRTLRHARRGCQVCRGRLLHGPRR